MDLTAKVGNKDVYDDLFTDEEKDIVGEQTLASMQKANKAAIEAAVGPLKDELTKVQEARVADSQRLNDQERTNLQGEFLAKLGNAVSDYQDIDTDPNFLKWMDGIDEMSGLTRKKIFLQSRDLGDVGRVAGFFNDYKTVRDGKGPEILEDAITPSASSAQPAAQKQQPTKSNKILESVIIKFYDYCSRNLYKGRESLRAKYEEQINHAIATGNVIAGR